MADRYANIAHIQVTESAVDTLTYKKLETGISLFEKVAWVIARLEYYWFLHSIPSSGAGINMAVATSNNPSAISPDEIAFIDLSKTTRHDLGTAGNGVILESPLIRDFSQLPGGGIIVPPNPLYLAIEGFDQAVVQIMDVRIYYTTIVLKADEFWELVEARRMISST